MMGISRTMASVILRSSTRVRPISIVAASTSTRPLSRTLVYSLSRPRHETNAYKRALHQGLSKRLYSSTTPSPSNSSTATKTSSSSNVTKILLFLGVSGVFLYVLLPGEEDPLLAQKKPTQQQPKEEALPDFGLPILSSEEITARLSQKQQSLITVDKEKQGQISSSVPVWRFDINSLSSNNPIEDYHVESMWDGKMIFGVFDGHGGTPCANILSQYLPSYVADHLRTIPTASSSAERQEQITVALKSAFKRLDNDIVNCAIPVPLAVADPPTPSNDTNNKNNAENNGKPPKQKESVATKVASAFSSLIRKPASTSEQDFASSITTAIAGACALVSVIDGDDLYVACTGDSRAVLGVMKSDGMTLEAIPLSEDQTPRNMNEYRRLLEEHPGEETTVVRKNRVLGGLMPSRAFGDARYKWSIPIQETLFSFIQTRRRTPQNYISPPYVTAEPEVKHAKLSKDTKFLVMATDGLWDELSNEDVVDLVSGYMKLHNLLPSSSDRKDVPKDGSRFSYSYQDENAATHLLRNALGGTNVDRIGRLLQIPAPYSRNFRDDMTISVIFFDVDESSQLRDQQVPDISSTASSASSSSSWWSWVPSFSSASTKRDEKVLNGFQPVDLSKAQVKRGKLEGWIDTLKAQLPANNGNGNK